MSRDEPSHSSKAAKGRRPIFKKQSSDRSANSAGSSDREQVTLHIQSAARFNRKSPVTAVMLAIGVCCAAGAVISMVHVHRMPQHQERTGVSSVLSDFKQAQQQQQQQPPEEADVLERKKAGIPKKPAVGLNSIAHEQRAGTRNRHKDGGRDEPPHYHTLQCGHFGGPLEKQSQEMVYWQDIPSDSHYVSPFHARKGKRRQYMTFEPDGGGWNNIRMAMETVVGLAIATGRTLVLPAEQRMYLLAQDRGKQKTDFSFMDFFPMRELANDNDGLTMITMKEFLEAEAMTGNLFDKETGEVAFPPGNETDWNGKDVKLLKEWLRNVTHTPLWSPSQCLAVFPASGEHKDAVALQQMLGKIVQQNAPHKVAPDTPLPVDATTIERMKESLAGRRELCLYDEAMQSEPVVHFMCSHKLRVRMLVHFYAFLFFEDWREDLWMKRFMRDHMRYVDELQCAAARIVGAIREHARSKNPTGNPSGDFDTFHIRRGDFQYKDTRITADAIYNNVKDILTEGATVYIATDEKSKNFFEPLKKHYDVLFMDDFMPQLEGVNKNQYGMIDQLVASRGRLFFGCWHSTFTGFINRMRGYHSVRDKLPGHEDGLLPNSYYYVPIGQKLVLHKYAPLHGAFFTREFPTSWRQIDKGIGNLPIVSDHTR